MQRPGFLRSAESVASSLYTIAHISSLAHKARISVHRQSVSNGTLDVANWRTHSWFTVGYPYTDRAAYAYHDMVFAVVYICRRNDVDENRSRFEVGNSECDDRAGRSRAAITQNG